MAPTSGNVVGKTVADSLRISGEDSQLLTVINLTGVAPPNSARTAECSSTGVSATPTSGPRYRVMPSYNFVRQHSHLVLDSCETCNQCGGADQGVGDMV